jgi:hypothetical protein
MTTSKCKRFTNSHTSQFTTAHTLVFSVCCLHQSLSGNGFQLRMFPFLWVPELSPASATSFSQQQLTTTEPQQFCKWLHLGVNVMLRSTVSRPVCLGVKHPSGEPKTRFVLVRQLRVCWCGAPSLTRGWDLLITIAAGLRQRRYSRVHIAWNSWPHFTASDSRHSQPGGPGPCTYVPQWQGGPVILPGRGFPFHRLLRLAGLRWRYSNPPPHKVKSQSYFTTGGLPPINLSWRQAPWDPRPEILSSTEPLR